MTLMECGHILKSAEAEEAEGNYEEAAKLYYKASLCFGMVNDPGNYEAAKRRSGELFMAVAEGSERPVPAAKAGMLAYKMLSELGDSRANDCVDAILGLMSNNREDLLADREVAVMATKFLRERGMVAEAVEIFVPLAEGLRNGGNYQLAARYYSDAASCEEYMKDLKMASRFNKAAGELFMSCELHLEASEHLVKAFLEGMAVGEADGSLLELSDEACLLGEIRENWHTELASVCKSLYRGDADAAYRKWKGIRLKFRPSYNSLVELAINEVKRQGLRSRPPSS